MIRKLLVTYVGALFLAISFVATGTVAFADSIPKEVTIRGGNVGGNWYTTAVGLGKILSDAGTKGGADLGGSNSNVIAVSVGKTEIGMTFSITLAMARNGEQPFKEKITNLRGLAFLTDNVVQIPVTRASGVKTIPDLKGKPFAFQPISAGITTIFRMILDAYGMSEDDLKVAARGGTKTAAAAVKDRRAVGFYAGGNFPQPTIVETSVSLPLRLLEVSDEAFEKVKQRNSGFYRAVLPAGTYKGQDEDVKTIGVAVMLTVNENMSDDHAYWITKALANGMEDIRALHVGLKGLTVKKMSQVSGAPIHPGAAKFYREAGVIK